MNEYIQIGLIIAGSVAVGSTGFWWFTRDRTDDFTKGVRYATRLLAGDHDDDVMDRLDIAEVTHEDRLAYLESMTMESQVFGTFNDFDKGCISMLPRTEG